MKKVTKIVWIAFLLLSFVSIGGVGHIAMAEKNVLRFGLGVDPTTLDPHYFQADTDLIVIKMVYETLVEFDLDMNIVPLLATSWEVVDDTTWRFKLRKGVKFHDGFPFDAKAVKINFDRMLESPMSQHFYGAIKSVTIEDDYTILLKTKTAYAPLLKNMCAPVGGMISPKAIETYGREVGIHPVGTGPFRFKEWRPKERVVVVRNDDYWGKKVKLDEFRLLPIPEEGTRAMAFEAGELDVISDPSPHRIPKYRADKTKNVVTVPDARVIWVAFNLGDEVLSNLKLRRAIAHAINRDEIVEYVLENLGLNAQAQLPEAVNKPKKKYNFDYNPDKAKKLLEEAGYPNGVDLKLWTCEGRYLKDRQIAEAAQAQLEKIGIRTKVRVFEWGAYMDTLYRHEGQIFIIGCGFASGDADGSTRAMFYSTEAYNYFNLKSPKMDAILDEAVSTLDMEKREDLYNQAQQLMVDEAVCVPIYHKINIYVTSDKVKNFHAHPLELLYIEDTTVE